MIKINKTQYGILSLLIKKNLSGYDIKQMAHQISPFHLSENNAQIYPNLKALEKAHLVKSYIDQKSGGRHRRIYSITPRGLDHLKVWLEEPIEPAQYREELLLKLTAGEHASISVFVKHLESYRDQILHQKKTLKTIQDSYDKAHSKDNRKMYLNLTYDYATLTLDAKLKWCQKSLKTLREHKK